MKFTNKKSLLLLIMVIFVSSCGNTSTEVNEEVQENPAVVEGVIDDIEEVIVDENEEMMDDATEEEMNDVTENIEETMENDSWEEEKTEVTTEARIITIEAKKWEYNPSVITVKQWENIIIEVINTDTLHWIGIPDMKLSWNDQITPDTSKKWTFEFRCTNYCGSGHQEMVWTLIVE